LLAAVSTPQELNMGVGRPRGDGTVYLWSLATGKLAARLQGRRETIESLAFSPDGKTLAAVSEGSRISVWDVPGGRHLRRLEPPPVGEAGERPAVVSRLGWHACRVAFRGDGRALAAAYSLPAYNALPTPVDVVVWDLDTGTRHRPFPNLPNEIWFA